VFLRAFWRHVSSVGLRRLLPVLAAFAVLTLPVTGAAGSDGNGNSQSGSAFVPSSLMGAAQADPKQRFDVIVQGRLQTSSADVAADVQSTADGEDASGGQNFTSISGVERSLSGKQIVKLATKSRILAITPNAPVRVAGNPIYSNTQQWPYVSGAVSFWPSAARQNIEASTIAIVDSGIDASRADFGTRVVKQVTICSRAGNSAGDGRGHGTFVASIAAGEAPGYAGAAPTAKLISIDVADDEGIANTSDVIAAADWILANKNTYGIKVANFSLHATAPASIRFDPLDKAVERLWFGGVTVVAAAGNYGVPTQASGVLYAPGNDPFVITVGANDTNSTIRTNDDVAASWSAYGYTYDGFAKPDIAAPGRFMIGAVPVGATLPLERPANVTAPGYMQLSGTSFSAPVVAGAAAYLTAMHPDWSPDQVKGALMLTAKPNQSSAPLSSGVGEVDLWRASNLNSTPPNPNLALDQFVVTPLLGGTPTFDDAAWTSAATLNPAWESASWTSAAWTSASWTSAAWTSAAWTSAAWTSASWTSASWTSASGSDVAAMDASSQDPVIGVPTVTYSDILALATMLGVSPDMIPTP
jgi:serine protease AprX